MKKPRLRFWHLVLASLIMTILSTVNNYLLFNSNLEICFLLDELLEQASIILLILYIYIIIRNIIRAIKGLTTRRSTGETAELERQREIEKKEIDMVRKSNEILLHLIQDEHRNEDR